MTPTPALPVNGEGVFTPTPALPVNGEGVFCPHPRTLPGKASSKCPRSPLTYHFELGNSGDRVEESFLYILPACKGMKGGLISLDSAPFSRSARDDRD